MTIDDYDSAMSLSHQLEASAPFKVRPGKHLLKLMQHKGKPMSAERDYLVEKVMYSGDEGGIICMLQGKATDKELIGSSLTHLVIDPGHPLCESVRAYQRQRTRRLRQQEQQGFAALVESADLAKQKKRRGGGFGT